MIVLDMHTYDEEPIVDWCLYASYRAHRTLYGKTAEQLAPWYRDAARYEQRYLKEAL